MNLLDASSTFKITVINHVLIEDDNGTQVGKSSESDKGFILYRRDRLPDAAHVITCGGTASASQRLVLN
jgi:hypothetical protein